jgi:archaellum component FlaC
LLSQQEENFEEKLGRILKKLEGWKKSSSLVREVLEGKKKVVKLIL